MGTIGLLFKTKARIGPFASAELLPTGVVEMDASIEELHVHTNQITQFPVEEGVDIADHVRRQPDRIMIRGIVTEDPITLGGGFGTGRSTDAYFELVAMLNEATVVEVVTSLRQYENMVVESMEVPRDKNRGNAAEMTINMRELLTVEVAAAAGLLDKGTQNGSTV
jgi:hypothetical protein